jgi:carbonic anhydrase
MTTPPCAENINWYIVEKNINIGFADLEMLREAVNLKK